MIGCLVFVFLFLVVSFRMEELGEFFLYSGLGLCLIYGRNLE